MLQQQPRRPTSASHFPLSVLVCTVVLAVALPLAAATAGPAPASPAEGAVTAVSSPPPQRLQAAEPGTAPDERAGGRSGKSPAEQGGAARSPSASCGSELTSPEGLTAQTCVMSEGPDTWARTYYSNATHTPLRAALSLRRPDGGSLRTDCAVSATDEPGVCETPHERSRTAGQRPVSTGSGAVQPYDATAEVASADGERMLLRSGSNTPAH
jgi:hypothetical protein